MPDLGAYLADVGGKRWIWGEQDCCTFPADWLIRCGRPDPMARWRGAYHDETSCAAIIREAGSLVPLWADALGEKTSGDPSIGDVGIVTLWGHQAGAIYTGRRWAFRTERGWMAATFDLSELAARWAN